MENQLVKITHIKKNNHLSIYGKAFDYYFKIIFKIYEKDNKPDIKNIESQILICDENNKYYFCDCSFSDISFIYDVDEPIQVDKFNCDDYNIPKYMYCIMIGMVSTNI
jgi:hypothetical protein